MTPPLQILIVDDQPRARQSLRALLSTWSPESEIQEAANGHEAVRLVEARQPHVVLMDIRLPEMDGTQATWLIKTCWPQVRVVVLTLYGEYEPQALAAGADAFIGKGEPPDQLLAALTSMATGQVP
jgi:DNA-binding NarL/FixJ family response regulator